jgi:hypothetical protein
MSTNEHEHEQPVMRRFMFPRGKSQNGTYTGALSPNDDEYRAAMEFNRTAQPNKTQFVKYLMSRGWSQAAIRNAVPYSDGRDMSSQHFNVIRAALAKAQTKKEAKTETEVSSSSESLSLNEVLAASKTLAEIESNDAEPVHNTNKKHKLHSATTLTD